MISNPTWKHYLLSRLISLVSFLSSPVAFSTLLSLQTCCILILTMPHFLLLGENRSHHIGTPEFPVPVPANLPVSATAPHSSALAWKIPWTEEPGGLQSMGSRRVRHDWATSLSLFTFMHWRRKWQPTPVFLPGESQGRGSLVGCCLWGHTESDMTEAT